MKADRAKEPELLRNAFKMKLRPGCEREYQKRHDEIWPEMRRELEKAGISDYSIYLDEETSTLFAFQKLAPDNTADDLPNSPVVRRWWNYMADIMEYDADNTPVVVTLREVFYMA